MYKGGRKLLPRSCRSLIDPGPFPLRTLTDVQKRGSLGRILMLCELSAS
jgi:hypothetical protein